LLKKLDIFTKAWYFIILKGELSFKRDQKGGILAKLMILELSGICSSFPRRERLAKANLIIFNAVEFSCAGTFRYLSSNNTEKGEKVLK